MKRKETIAVSLDSDLIKELRKIAAEENRKISNLVETILKRDLNNDKNKAEQ